MHDGAMRVVSSWPWLRVAMVLFAAGAAVCEHAAAQRPTSFACKRVLAADGRSWLEDQVLHAMGPSIFQLLPRREGEQVDVDFGDAWVIPGLIDLHTHLFLRPYAQMSWDEQVRNESVALRSMRSLHHAEATLRAGFFAVRDLGTEGAGYADVDLRNPKGPSKGDFRVLRGGSFRDGRAWLRSARRHHELPSVAHPWVGFRCAKSAP